MASKQAGSCRDFVARLKHKRVYVKLNDGSAYAGTLICIDGNLNTVLEAVGFFDSIEEAQTAKGSNSRASETFSDVFIRGNNVCFIAPCSEGGSKKSKKDQNQSQSASSSSSGSRSSGSSSSSSSSQSAANRELMIQTVNEEGL
mmetsp:Transcript_19886/g.26842  ORF Transcript_19886/g.26842 Transcript_19886/m.26842 type:complete len:144 (+) Transcript_19886:9-440(+)